MGFGKTQPQGLVADSFTQVVQVRRRQLGDALVARIAVVVKGPFQEVNDGRSADILVRFICVFWRA